MTTLRVLLAAPSSATRADPWALFDAAGACVRTGIDRPNAWPNADRLEFVIAAAHVRIASVALPPMPAARVAAAAGFALDDQLAGPAGAQVLAASRQAPDGRVRVVVVARALLESMAAASSGRVARIVAESDLAPPLVGWRWCVSEGATGGFVRRPDGSAFPVGEPAPDGDLPPELALALAQAARSASAPREIRVDAAIGDAALAAWQREFGLGFVRGGPWRWYAAPAAAFAAAVELHPGARPVQAPQSARFPVRKFLPALWLAGAALGIHVAATVGEWVALRIDAWRDAREWTSLAAAAGVSPDAATDATSARAALALRYAELRHAHGLPAPDDALPLLARASAPLATLPPGALKSAAYGSGHWTLDIARADASTIRELDARMRAAGVPTLIAAAPDGARVRFGGP